MCREDVVVCQVPFWNNWIDIIHYLVKQKLYFTLAFDVSVSFFFFAILRIEPVNRMSLLLRCNLFDDICGSINIKRENNVEIVKMIVFALKFLLLLLVFFRWICNGWHVYIDHKFIANCEKRKKNENQCHAINCAKKNKQKCLSRHKNIIC